MASETQSPAPWPGKASDYRGYERHDFTVDGCPSIIVAPKAVATGRPWVWRAEFFDAFPQIDLALLKEGFHLAYMNVGNTFGCPSAMRHFDAFYKTLTGQHGLSKKPVLEGLSRGGLYVYNWGAANPEKVACILADNAVCDFKSWPGGKGKGKGSPGDWQKLIRDYGFNSEQEALAYDKNPIDNLKTLAAAKVPLLHLAGDADDVVPYAENTLILQQRYEKLGGPIEVIIKKGMGHHPHGLDDPTPAVKFIRRAIYGEEDSKAGAAAKANIAWPTRGAVSLQPAGNWEQALVTGNGRMGAMIYGRPVLAELRCQGGAWERDGKIPTLSPRDFAPAAGPVRRLVPTSHWWVTKAERSQGRVLGPSTRNLLPQSAPGWPVRMCRT